MGVPLDLIPAAESERIEAGVVQTVRALEAFLADVYGPAEVVSDGVVPRSLLTTFGRLPSAERRTDPSPRDRPRPRHAIDADMTAMRSARGYRG